jgi:hypothetical protein
MIQLILEDWNLVGIVSINRTEPGSKECCSGANGDYDDCLMLEKHGIRRTGFAPSWTETHY